MSCPCRSEREQVALLEPVVGLEKLAGLRDQECRRHDEEQREGELRPDEPVAEASPRDAP